MKKRPSRILKLHSASYGLRLGVLFVSFFILFGFLGMAIIDTYNQTSQKNQQLAGLEADLKKEEDKNAALIQQRDYYKSTGYIEKEARNTLGLSYPNEEIYVLKKNPTNLPTVTPIANSPVSNTVDQKTNKWLELIFGQ